MNRDLIPKSIDKAVRSDAALRSAAARQIVEGESIEFQAVLGKQHVSITDRRIVITKVGAFLGERAESIPINAITGFATTVRSGHVVILQLAVPGRTWGELALAGEDLDSIHGALVRCLPALRSAA